MAAQSFTLALCTLLNVMHKPLRFGNRPDTVGALRLKSSSSVKSDWPAFSSKRRPKQFSKSNWLPSRKSQLATTSRKTA